MIRDPSDGSVKPAKPALRTLDDLRAKYGPNWGLKVSDERPKSTFKAMTSEELIQFYRTNPERVARLMGETGE